MGFIDEATLAARDAELTRRMTDLAAREQATQKWIEECLQRQRRSVAEFCSPESLGAIAQLVQEHVAEKFTQTGAVERVYIPYPVSMDITNSTCVDALLEHLRTIDPATTEVRLHQNPDFLTGKKYKEGCIVVRFSPTLIEPSTPPV